MSTTMSPYKRVYLVSQLNYSTSPIRKSIYYICEIFKNIKHLFYKYDILEFVEI